EYRNIFTHSRHNSICDKVFISTTENKFKVLLTVLLSDLNENFKNKFLDNNELNSFFNLPNSMINFTEWVNTNTLIYKYDHYSNPIVISGANSSTGFIINTIKHLMSTIQQATEILYKEMFSEKFKTMTPAQKNYISQKLKVFSCKCAENIGLQLIVSINRTRKLIEMRK
ncbi:hypothetical protein CDIK_4460, partial [Cucumispora dikerogammari]